MQQLLGYLTIIVIAAMPVAAIFFVRYKWHRNRRERRRTRADLTGIVRDHSGK